MRDDTEHGRSRKRPKAGVAVGLSVLLAIAALGCGSDDDGGASEASSGGPPEQPVKIRMGWGIPAEEIKYVLMRNPRLAEHLGTWYEMEWREFAGTALGVQGLAAETLDCATVGGLSVANGIEQGADVVILGEFIEERTPYFSTPWMVKNDSGIDSLADLRGKTVATNAVAGSSDYVQDFWIEKEAGLVDGEDYEKVEVPFGSMQETLLSGRVDMGLFPQPFYGAVNATGEVKEIFRLTDVINPFVQLLNACRRSFVEDNREAIEKFQEDWASVANYVLDPKNREAVIEASAAATKIPAEVLEPFLLTRRDFYRPENGAVNVEALQREWDFFREQGAFKQELEVRDYIVEELLPPGSQGG
jgi:ABC-type nitrate/sulfonate/bicarbonate transport system substrate-binding protein